jgi:hypothetical protein
MAADRQKLRRFMERRYVGTHLRIMMRQFVP